MCIIKTIYHALKYTTAMMISSRQWNPEFCHRFPIYTPLKDYKTQMRTASRTLPIYRYLTSINTNTNLDRPAPALVHLKNSNTQK